MIRYFKAHDSGLNRDYYGKVDTDTGQGWAWIQSEKEWKESLDAADIGMGWGDMKPTFITAEAMKKITGKI